MQTNKILLLGGTGAIGSYLSTILAKNELDVYITSRTKHLDNGNIHYIECNAKLGGALSNLCKSHWSTIVDFMSYKTDEFSRRLDILLSATDQYIFLSSARVFADEEHPIKESSPRLLDVSKDKEYLKTDEYALTKARQENILQSSNKRNWTIVRPYVTYGDKRLQLGVLEKEEWLYRALHGRTIIFTKDIANKITSLANGYDVALGISHLIGKNEALGDSFNITTPERLRWSQILEIYRKIIREKTSIDIKVKYVDVADFISCRGEGLRYQVIYDRLFNRDFDTTKEAKFIDTRRFTNVEEGLSACLSNFINMGTPFKTIGWKQEGRKDRISKERTPLHEIPGIKNKINYLKSRYL